MLTPLKVSLHLPSFHGQLLAARATVVSVEHAPYTTGRARNALSYLTKSANFSTILKPEIAEPARMLTVCGSCRTKLSRVRRAAPAIPTPSDLFVNHPAGERCRE